MDAMSFTFKHPSNILIVDPTGAGFKTHLVQLGTAESTSTVAPDGHHKSEDQNVSFGHEIDDNVSDDDTCEAKAVLPTSVVSVASHTLLTKQEGKPEVKVYDFPEADIPAQFTSKYLALKKKALSCGSLYPSVSNFPWSKPSLKLSLENLELMVASTTFRLSMELAMLRVMIYADLFLAIGNCYCYCEINIVNSRHQVDSVEKCIRISGNLSQRS